MRRLNYILGFLLLVIVQACAPRPVFRMTPRAKHTTFVEGTEYVHRQRNGIKLTIAYYRHFSKLFAMDVTIENNTDSVLRVDPTQFSYDAFNYYRGPIPGDSAKVIASRRAKNPESEILKKDLAISRSVAHQKTSNLLYGIGQALTVAGGAITDSTQVQQNQTAQDLQTNALNHEIGSRNRALKRQSLRTQRRIWQMKTIRKTDLFPGDFIQGYVFFRNEKDASGYMFHYDVAHAHFKVFFTQQKYHP